MALGDEHPGLEESLRNFSRNESFPLFHQSAFFACALDESSVFGFST